MKVQWLLQLAERLNDFGHGVWRRFDRHLNIVDQLQQVWVFGRHAAYVLSRMVLGVDGPRLP